jgi:Skp family chaperone for outer membrane proteins
MTKLQRLGWIISAAVLGVLLASGFQGSMDKVATVDLNSMVETSDMGKAGQADFDKMKDGREGLLKFLDDTRVLTIDQANTLRTLWLKPAPTAAETASLERLKADVVAQAKKNVELSTKPNLTAEERTLLQEYASRSAAIEQVAGQWLDEFRQEMRGWAEQRKADTLKKAKAAAQQVAKAQGFSLVFDSSVAVYAANDLTDEALKTMNANK